MQVEFPCPSVESDAAAWYARVEGPEDEEASSRASRCHHSPVVSVGRTWVRCAQVYVLVVTLSLLSLHSTVLATSDK